jgi:hypothetical protein
MLYQYQSALSGATAQVMAIDKGRVAVVTMRDPMRMFRQHRVETDPPYCALINTETGATIFGSTMSPTVLNERPIDVLSLDKVWKALADTASINDLSVWLQDPGASVAYLKRKLVLSTGPINPQETHKRIDALDDDDPQTREVATQELEASGRRALPLLQRALESQPSPEAETRLRLLIATVSDPRGNSNTAAISLLGQIGTRQAIAVLRDLSNSDDATLAAPARSAIRSFSARHMQ